LWLLLILLATVLIAGLYKMFRYSPCGSLVLFYLFSWAVVLRWWEHCNQLHGCATSFLLGLTHIIGTGHTRMTAIARQ